ncbi:MAG: extracellular solute-binding protein, partial [Coleofasciculus sp. Co-bin14]|nr:extracellular solute-binding protein [Coleofasciculus sp. Co-bin14]
MKRLVRSVGLPCLLGILVACILISQFWVRPALTQEPVTLNFLINAGEVPYWKDLMIEDFEKQNPDIRIQIIEAPNATDLTENLYTSAFILGDSPYDLVYMDVIWTSKFAAAGWLRDLSERVT